MKSDDPWREADQWLERALAVPAGERKALLDQCPNEDLKSRVLKLVELAERSDGLFSPGAPIAQLEAMDLVVGHRLLDRYELVEKVGQGAMGAVFRARDTKLDRDVAVKVVSGAAIDASACERLLREARAAAALNHPNVVAIHDVGEEDGQPFFVMELVEGDSLENAPPGDVASVVATARQICAALEHAHSRGVVHRDLKPSNVLVVNDDEGRTVKLVDLGLALARDTTRVTAEGHVLGTPAYMAPEQALGKDVDGRADLYALGVMMYHWVTGKLPFAGDDALAVIAQHINAALTPPRTLAPELPAELDNIIERLLAKDPARRFARAAELSEALGAIGTINRAVQTADTVDTLQVPATRATASDSREMTQRINRRLTGGTELPPMYGREKFLETVDDAVRRLTGPHPSGSVLLIAGEPGTGKSRVVAELAERAGHAGALVLVGMASELSNRIPYAPFVEAWNEHIQAFGRPAAENPFASFEPSPGSHAGEHAPVVSSHRERDLPELRERPRGRRRRGFALGRRLESAVVPRAPRARGDAAAAPRRQLS